MHELEWTEIDLSCIVYTLEINSVCCVGRVEIQTLDFTILSAVHQPFHIYKFAWDRTSRETHATDIEHFICTGYDIS